MAIKQRKKNNLRRALGALLFFGSFVIYALVFYVATINEITITERAGLAGMLYALSWGTFALGSLLLGPEFLESLKKVNVAVRSGEIYDKPELWGLELRFNHFDTCGSADHAALSDSIRRVLHSQKYPVGIDTVRKLLKQSNLDPLKALQKTWFRGNKT